MHRSPRAERSNRLGPVIDEVLDEGQAPGVLIFGVIPSQSSGGRMKILFGWSATSPPLFAQECGMRFADWPRGPYPRREYELA